MAAQPWSVGATKEPCHSEMARDSAGRATSQRLAWRGPAPTILDGEQRECIGRSWVAIGETHGRWSATPRGYRSQNRSALATYELRGSCGRREGRERVMDHLCSPALGAVQHWTAPVDRLAGEEAGCAWTDPTHPSKTRLRSRKSPRQASRADGGVVATCRVSNPGFPEGNVVTVARMILTSQGLQ